MAITTSRPSEILTAAAGLLQMSVGDLQTALAAQAERPSPADPLLTRREAAALFRVSRRTIQNWQDSGKLRAIHINKRVCRYRSSDIQRLLDTAA